MVFKKLHFVKKIIAKPFAVKHICKATQALPAIQSFIKEFVCPYPLRKIKNLFLPKKTKF